MFEELIANMQRTIAARIFRVQPLRQAQTSLLDKAQLQQSQQQVVNLSQAVSQQVSKTPASPTKAVAANHQDLAAALGGTTNKVVQSSPVSSQSLAKDNSAETKKIGRNDPCPCGSGLKYKKCGLLNKCEENGGTPWT